MAYFALVLRLLAVSAMMARASKRRSLTSNGIKAAAVTGFIHAIHPWSIFTILLFTFFITGTAFTKVKVEIKRKLTTTSNGEEGGEGPRNEIQVLANSLPATLLIVLHLFTRKLPCFHNDLLVIGIFAQYAAVTADTWSSELGILSKTRPFLITTLRQCPPGTNGGVSVTGLKAAAGGGFIIGLMAALFTPFCQTWTMWARTKLVLGITLAGFVGSVLDSVLGATLQESVANEKGKIIEVDGGHKMRLQGKTISGRNVMSNNEVNLTMASVTTMLAIGFAKFFCDF
ncbi:integral membrane protein DUF92-domain-containing protein [Limtongia smithiae]|uniref:integral membrane protein DUF92-domain-containing protein n=1 Tax=Limtongia smithiae TaxID=1125753 RepID=UPI0034CF1013